MCAQKLGKWWDTPKKDRFSRFPPLSVVASLPITLCQESVYTYFLKKISFWGFTNDGDYVIIILMNRKGVKRKSILRE